MIYTLMVIICTLIPCELVRQYVMSEPPKPEPELIQVDAEEPYYYSPTYSSHTVVGRGGNQYTSWVDVQMRNPYSGKMETRRVIAW